MITVIGEALIELSPTSDAAMLRALPGGSALNIAVGAARLGCPAALVARLSRDRFGQLLRRHAIRNGVDLSGAPDADEPTAIAVVPAAGIGRDARPSLYSSGVPSWQWRPGDLAWIPAETSVLHIGSLTWCAASSTANVLRAVSRVRQRGALVSMDLTVHPEVMRTPGQGRILLERSLRAAEVVRTSIEDIGWLYPGRAPQAIAELWLRMGPGLVIVTSGVSGAMAFRGPGSVLHRPAVYPADVVDTAGADDAYTAALLTALYAYRKNGAAATELTSAAIADALDLASLAAGMTCERPGADPPTAGEVRERRDQRSRSRAAVPGAYGVSRNVNVPRQHISGLLTPLNLRSC
jgi:fructokinase